MKTKQQIRFFLEGKGYKSDTDYLAIKGFCLSKYALNIPEPTKECGLEGSVSWESFQSWYANGYGAGDVVDMDGSAHLVVSGDDKKAVICSISHINGPTINYLPVSLQLLSPSKNNALESVYLAFSELGVWYDPKTNRIKPKYKPSKKDVVEYIDIRTQRGGYGIYRENDNGKAVMYVIVEKSGKVRCGLREELGTEGDYVFVPSPTSGYPRKAIEKALEGLGKRWNHRMARVEPLDMSVREGNRYWYISDKLEVRHAIENRTLTSRKRYLAGNYFKSFEEAIDAAEEIGELLKARLCGNG